MIEKKHLILCGSVPQEASVGYERHRLSLGKKADQINLDIEGLNQKVVQDLPPLLRDLLDIAVYVYVGDQVVARGGQRSFDYGGRWHREMTFRIPVRDSGIWTDPAVAELLEEALSVASGNTFRFEFHQLLDDHSAEYLTFPQDAPVDAIYDEVLLFSGGLDSFTGAVDEVISKGSRPVLVSHQSHNRMKKLQRDLFAYLYSVSPRGKHPLHIPVLVNKDKNLTCETSQRTRSFLYAALGTIVARILRLNRVRFYENGIVSCNLQWDNQTLQARATRSTHPKVLSLLSQLISEVTEVEFVIENPYFGKTRTEVCERLQTLRHEATIKGTRSCASSIHHNPETHCGVCSQCLDRRFATIAAQCAEHDPDWLYALKIFQDPLTKPRDRQMGLGFVGFAGAMEGLTLDGFVRKHSSELHEIAAYMPDEREKAFKYLYDLHRRHARQVNEVLDAKLSENISNIRSGVLDADCLLRAVASGEHLRERKPARKAGKGAKTRSLARQSRQTKATAERMQLVSTLLAHHGFSDDTSDGELNLNPATQASLGKTLEWGQEKVSRVLKRAFPAGFWARYRQACKSEVLGGFLKALDDGSTDIESAYYRPQHATEREERDAEQYG